MSAPISLMYPDQWLREGHDHHLAPVALVDDDGAVLASIVDCWLTLYDVGTPEGTVVNGLNRTSIKNTARYSFMGGYLTVKLTHDDLAIDPDATKRYTRRNALVEYSYGTGGAKTGTQEWYFIVRHVDRFPAVVP